MKTTIIKPLTEKVTVEQEVTGIIADLVYFVRYVGQRNLDPSFATDNQLINLAREFWDTQHGEE